MKHQSRRKRILALVYVLMSGAILWQAARIVYDIRQSSRAHYGRYYTVTVGGNIDKPGRYRVPYGTTSFEILRMAGVRTTSDFSAINLATQVEANKDITVGTRATPAALNPRPAAMRLEFFLGDVSVLSEDGQTRLQQEGLQIEPGDRIITDDKSQAEISMGEFSRINIDKFSEITAEKIESAEEGKKVTQIAQRAGACWYKVVYTAKDQKTVIMPGQVSVTVAGAGADFLIEVEQDMVRINTMDGLLLIERPNGEESLNLIAGQTITAYTDGRPLQVTRLALDISASERFAELAKEKTNYMMRFVPVNLLFCGVPGIYYLVSLQYESGRVYVVNIPAALSVQEFAQGMHSLDEAFLQGGVVFVSTILEQIMSARISNYCVFTRDNIMTTASVLGGISVDIDKTVAPVLGVPTGTQKLSAEQLVKYMSPSVSGADDARRRQANVLKGVFKGFQSKGIVLTALAADQITANIETNFSGTDLMNNYSRFMEKSDWNMREKTFPVKTGKVGNTTVTDADLTLARKLLVDR